MNFRLTAILFGAIFVLGVVLLVLTLTDDKDAATGTVLEELAAVKPDQITDVEIEREGSGKLKMTRADQGRWNIVEPYPAPADPSVVNRVVADLLKAKPVAQPGMSSNPSVLGLQPPGLRVTLRQGTERSATLNLGDVSLGGTGPVVFATTSARPDRPVAVPAASIESLFRSTAGISKAVDLAKWVGDYRVKSVFPGTRGAEDVEAVSLSARGKTLALRRDRGGWAFVNPSGWGQADPQGAEVNPPGSFTGVRPLLNALTNLQASSGADFVENASPQDLKNYGLEPGSPDAVRVELTNKDGQTTVAFLGKADAPAPPAPGQFMPPQPKRWVRVEGQPGVIRATAPDVSGLAALVENPDPLRDRTLLATEESRLDGIDVTAAGQTVRLRRPGGLGAWRLYGNPAAGDPQTASGAESLVGLLTARRTVTGFPPASDANFASRVGEVKVWADAFENPADPKAEPKERAGAKPTTLIFGRREGGSVHVRRVLPDGTTADFTVPERVKAGREDLDVAAVLGRTRLDYLDRHLKGFAATNANKLTVSGVANYDLDRKEPEGLSAAPPRWEFAGPPDRKGQTADGPTVADMLTTLANFNEVRPPARFVDETPSPEKLAEYGLAPAPNQPAMPGTPPSPRLRVVVGLAGAAPEDKERVYEFGNATGEFVFARQAGRASVFTVPKAVYDKFASADLRDRAIFRFDPAQVTGVEVRGWKVGGLGTDLDVTRNNNVWEAKVRVNNGPPGPFNLDTGKLDAFLRLLASTRVKSFVPGPQKGEQGFGAGSGELSVLIRIANDPGIHLVVDGPADGAASYFGWTSRVPGGQVFSLDAAAFKAFRESPEGFGRP